MVLKGMFNNGVKAACTGVGAYTMGVLSGPVGFVAMMTVANMVPAIYNNKKEIDRAVEEAEKELHRNNQTFYDVRIDHRFELNREPTQLEWATISERWSKGESGGSILKSMNLID